MFLPCPLRSNSAKTERDLNDFIGKCRQDAPIDGITHQKSRIVSHLIFAFLSIQSPAHEVRNPISAAMSACSFVSASVNEKVPLTTPASREAVRDDVLIIENSLQFVNDLLRNMLDFHRAASNKMVLEPTPTDVKADILEPVSSMIYKRYEHYEVLVECSDDLIVSVDRLRLKQIILNLARNSAKFVTKGYILLKAEVCHDGGGVYLSVEDSGPGIPESKRADMFRRFQDSLDSLQQGTGIGLNLCQTLMDIMGGSIYLDESYHSNLPDCPGAKFVVYLKENPLTMESVTDATAEEFEVSSSSGGDIEQNLDTAGELPENLSVLFVDDDMILRKLFSRTVKKLAPGWAIQEAANGEHAISLVKQDRHFDLIFLDQYMTSADKCLLGTETAQALRAIDFKGALCGLSANDMEKSFIAAGADSFMMKPFPCKLEQCKGAMLRVLADHCKGQNDERVVEA
jgi:CheY-like chemotaxis protein